MLIGERLRAFREQKKLFQEDLEKRTGLRPVYVSHIKNGILGCKGRSHEHIVSNFAFVAAESRARMKRAETPCRFHTSIT
jgi:hypothetical protein